MSTIPIPPDDTPLRARPDVADQIPSKKTRDLLGREQGRRIGWHWFFRALPGMFAQFSTIPGDFWAQDVNDDGFSEAVVSCPCGETPHIEVGCVEKCVCERWFFFAGPEVLVANSPARQAESQPTAEPA